jgi:origin recognition complex subunit 1
LGIEDHPWEWIYEKEEDDEAEDDEDKEKSATARRRRSKSVRYATNEQKIVGARMGNFKCKIGDCVLLKAEGTNAAWVGIICELMEAMNEDGEIEKQAKFMCKSPRHSRLQGLIQRRVLL